MIQIPAMVTLGRALERISLGACDREQNFHEPSVCPSCIAKVALSMAYGEMKHEAEVLAATTAVVTEARRYCRERKGVVELEQAVVKLDIVLGLKEDPDT